MVRVRSCTIVQPVGAELSVHHGVAVKEVVGIAGLKRTH